MSNNKQQTAVDYYSKEIGRLTSDLITGKITGKQFVMLEIQLLEQAKEMEQNQITLAHIDAAIFTEWDILTDARKNADQYYKQTYGGGEQ
jgi:phage regulator Rha-like protein